MAKSSFWDDLGNTLTRKAKGLSSRAENLYEIQKIRNKLSAQAYDRKADDGYRKDDLYTL